MAWCQPPATSRTSASGGSCRLERTAHGRYESCGLGVELRHHRVDLLVDRFVRDLDHHQPGQELLHDDPEDAAQDDEGEQHHEDNGQKAAQLEPGMKPDQREAEQAEPEMSLHPRCGSSEAPGRNFATKTQAPA